MLPGLDPEWGDDPGGLRVIIRILIRRRPECHSEKGGMRLRQRGGMSFEGGGGATSQGREMAHRS